MQKIIDVEELNGCSLRSTDDSLNPLDGILLTKLET